MCGIAGVYSRNLEVLSRIQAMTKVQSHRGPDGMGHLLLGEQARLGERSAPVAQTGDWLALGHRRLAIVDCTPAGAQPMASADRRDWISYNGEIYNYLELRDELVGLGFNFRSGTDTEVILCAYRAWGLGCFERFNGMWALALWDGERRRLVLSRDRLGVKPLFYAQSADALVFSSEIKGILASGCVKATLNRDVAVDYLKWSMVNHRHDSFFAGIQSLPPGHYAVVDDTLQVRPEPFWSLERPGAETAIDISEASVRFAELFRDSVKLRLRSDVPVGSCLSGGLDSSAIVCQADELRPVAAGALHTFNAASEDPRFDERSWCALVNQSVDAAAHHVFPSGEEFDKDLDALIWHQEEPFTSASIYAQWAIMREARANNIPVLLDGQGADEGLCGYRKFYLFYLGDLIRRRRIGRLLSEVYSLVVRGDRGMLRWREGARYLPAFLRGRTPSLSAFLTSSGKALWDRSQLSLGGRTSIAERQVMDLTKFSVPSLLRYEDRNSMAWSIESRVPFLDYRLVEWLVSLPAEVKLAGGQTKAVMRQALRGLVPDAILDRRDKMGFVTAQEVWMRDTLRPAIEHCFSDPDFPLADLVNPAAVLQEYRAWLQGKSRFPQRDFFRLFLLARWVTRFDVK
ncbi:MAG: asparagine synthase (glutamine-hydrolyzing) [Candidatus Accumulibacter meliphilus]|jgi:asparagine synthase (glutamine-hydrolysing)|uniref:asparagine synthase (glutamine-hydrolyzing) n=1 Tax=Candidatus Accumulibacter meliphilus TaxID=2211374 RepID=UPI002FC28D62